MSAPRVLAWAAMTGANLVAVAHSAYDLRNSRGREHVPLISQADHDAEVARLRTLVAQLADALKDVISTDLDAARFDELIDAAEKELGDG